MFTGIVKDVGAVESTRKRGGGVRLSVRFSNPDEFGDLAIDESVAINGACQTVVAVSDRTFEVDTIQETLEKTTLGSLRPGEPVNLERAVRPIDRLGGHFVQGHVDCVGVVQAMHDHGESREIWISFPEHFDALVVPIGSIAIDGVSLTVAKTGQHSLAVAIIPYTFGNTTISTLAAGQRVNLEFDILGKYIARQRSLEESAGSPSAISESWLRGLGY